MVPNEDGIINERPLPTNARASENIPFHSMNESYKMACPPRLVERIKTRKIAENNTLLNYFPFERQESGKEEKK